MCDEQGVCEQVHDGVSAAAPGDAEPEEQDDADSQENSNNESEMSFEDCVADAADQCRSQCDDEIGFGAVDCKRDCLEDKEGQCEEYDSDLYDSSASDGECEDCLDVCESACDQLLQSWRRDNCLSECESRCEYRCDS